MPLKNTIQEDMKTAMRSGEKDRLSVIRMLLAAVKQREIDERIELDDTNVTAVIEKLVKQRQEASKQFRDAERNDLADKEDAEMKILQHYLPEPLSETETSELIASVIEQTGATSIKDMGKVMNALKTQAAGRLDMSKVSAAVRQHLS
ncbi:MAG: GatB/YqeY domain-containing protein [Gammaproteobacteria bacterium]|nr:GatB/YqeY domain-containing protein [Gammaproteobacteria bacterium]